MRTPSKHVAKDGRVSYRVKFRVPTRETGARDGSTSESFPTLAQARRFAQLLDLFGPVRAIEEFDAEQRRSEAPTLDELAEQYFTWKEADVRSDRTIADYRRDYRNWISPTLGRRRVDGIVEADVQRWVDSMRGKLAPKSIADRHAILHAIYKWAGKRSRRIVEFDPCEETQLPKRRSLRPKGFRQNEYIAMYSALTQIDPDAADLVEFMLASGWRWSEATALDVADVEDDGTRVRVGVSHVIRRNAAGEHVLVEDAKSDAGMRAFSLDLAASAMVRSRIGNRLTGLVFTNANGHQWHHSNFIKRIWYPAVKAAGLTDRHPTPHWLRHSQVFWLESTGKVTQAQLAKRIGHEHISTTIDVYGTMIGDVSPEALEAFAAMRQARELPATDQT